MELAAACVGIADVCARTTSKIWRLTEQWRDAPRDVHQLRDELSHAHDFFGEVRLRVKLAGNLPFSLGRATATPAAARLGQLLERGVEILAELESIIDRVREQGKEVDTETADGEGGRGAAGGMSKRRKLAWILGRRRIQALRVLLKDLMQSVCGQLMALNISITTELHYAVETSRDEVVGHVQDTVETSTHRITTHFDRRLELANEDARSCLDERMAMRADEIKSHIDRRIHGLRDELFAHPAGAAQPPVNQKYQSSTKQPTSREVEAVLAAMKLMLKSGDFPAHAAVVAPDHDLAAKPPPYEELPTVPAPLGAGQCTLPCDCICHSFATFTAWRLTSLESFVGSVTVGYAGYAPDRQPCDLPACRSVPASSIRVFYAFPKWLVSTAIACQITAPWSSGRTAASSKPVSSATSTLGSPELLLRVIQRVNRLNVHYKQHLLSYSTRGDLDAVKALIRSSLSPLHDVESSRGVSPLACATIQRHVPVIEVLIKSGADPFQEDGSGKSPARAAFELYLGGTETGRRIAALFPLTRFVETAGFTDLHRIVIGALHVEIVHALRQPQWRSEIDAGDNHGTTALSLAAMKGDVRAVDALLTAGADPNRRHPATGQTPLHDACAYGRVEVVRRMLEGGADVNITGFRGTYPLHSAMLTQRNSIPCAQLLLDRGADVDARDRKGCDAITATSMRDDAEAAAFMIDRGARVSSYLDNEGDARVNDAINDRAHAVVRVYLERGATYRTINKMGCNIMHHLGALADAEIMRIFAEERMTGVDPGLVDSAGRTPRDAFEARWSRTGRSEALKRAWEGLLKSVEVGRGEVEDEGDVTDDEFHDALETTADS